jgi:FKBP-type peptidyl-prolyl cis-trans isomerase
MDKAMTTATMGTKGMALLLGVLLAACHSTKKKPVVEKPKDTKSYGLGYQTGANLRTEKIEVSVDDYLAGARDALAGSRPQMSQQQIRAAVMEARAQFMVTRKAALKDKAEKNLSEGKVFLDKNRKAAGVKVLPSGLQYKVLKQGTGRTPKAGDTVTLNYRSRRIDGFEFASSFKQDKPASVGVNQVIPAWREALQLMKEGAQWQLTVPPDLAYGAKGAPGVEPNSALVFEVELLAVTPAAKGKSLSMR